MARPHRTHRFKTTSSIAISVAPEVALARISAPETWPEWQSEILSTEPVQGAEARNLVHGKARLLGFDVHGRSLTVGSGTGRFEQDVVVGVRMSVTYEVEPRSTGCSVVHHLEADLPGGLAGRILSVLLARRLRKMQVDLLSRLKAQAEELV